MPSQDIFNAFGKEIFLSGHPSMNTSSEADAAISTRLLFDSQWIFLAKGKKVF